MNSKVKKAIATILLGVLMFLIPNVAHAGEPQFGEFRGYTRVASYEQPGVVHPSAPLPDEVAE